MKCRVICENIKLQMGHYQLKTHIFSIDMGGCDIVLGVEWLCTLGLVTIGFPKEVHVHILRGIHVGSPKITISHCMQRLLKKCHSSIISQFNSIYVMYNLTQKIHPHL
jgi:hypothetical protein